MTARLENVQFDGNASCFPHGIEFKVLACATGSSLATAANMGAASEGTSVRARMQYRLKGAGNEAVIDENILLDANFAKRRSRSQNMHSECTGQIEPQSPADRYPGLIPIANPF